MIARTQIACRLNPTAELACTGHFPPSPASIRMSGRSSFPGCRTLDASSCCKPPLIELHVGPSGPFVPCDPPGSFTKKRGKGAGQKQLYQHRQRRSTPPHRVATASTPLRPARTPPQNQPDSPACRKANLHWRHG